MTQKHSPRLPRWLMASIGSALALWALGAQAKTCAVPAANKVCTDENVEIVLTPADFVPGGMAFDEITAQSMPQTGGISNDGALVYPSSVPISYSNIAAGKVKWTPAQDQSGTFTFTFQAISGGTATANTTLTLQIDPINSAPTINIDQTLLLNAEFTAPLGLPNVNGSNNTPYWQSSGNVEQSDGLLFNTGQSTPNAIVQQVVDTVPGTTYTLSLATYYLGFVSSAQNIAVSAVNGELALTAAAAPADVLVTQNYAQDWDKQNQTLDFVATGTRTTIRIQDISTDSYNTDFILSYLRLTGPGPALRTTNEDTPLVWSASGVPPAITISDPDGTTGDYTLALTVTNGTLKLGSLTGLTVTAGADASPSVTITGTQADINAALNGLTYTPTLNYFSPNASTDKLTLVLNDNGNNGACSPSDPNPCAKTASGEVPLQVLPVNDAPVAVADSITVAEGGAATTLVGGATSVLANDSDAEGDALTAILPSGPANGSLTLNANGTFSYVHDGSATTSDSFTYKANDGSADSNVVTVTISVTPATKPTGNTDSYRTQVDTVLTVPAPGVLANDSVPAGVTAPLSATLATGPAHGTLTLNANGSLVYTPAANFVGSDSFTYVASYDTTKSMQLKAAPMVDSDPVTVTIDVTAAPPVATTPTPVPALGAAGLLALTSLLGGCAMLQRRKTGNAR